MIPFISWGAKWCSIQILHIIILSRKTDFPSIQSLTMKILVQMHGLLCGQRHIRRLCTDKTEEKKRLSTRCAPVGCRTCAPASKSQGKKFWIGFSSISDELTVNQVGWGRFLILQVSETKRKANEVQMREEFTKLPSGVANLLALFSSLCEQKVSAYMPSWTLLGMTTVW